MPRIHHQPMLRAGPLLSRFFRHLLPAACLLCDQTLPGADQLDLCSFCRAALPWNENACPRCAQPLAGAGRPGEPCEQCRQRPPPFTHALAPLSYEGCTRIWVRRLKDHLGLVEGRVLGLLMADAAARAYRLSGATPPDLLVPVPLTSWRLARRGHNQALTLALPVARRLGIPVLRRAVVRRRGGGHQRGRSRAQRLEAAADVFASRIDWHDRAPCVAIVDDVITTGTTAAALARILLAAGAAEVHVIAAARTPQRRRHGSSAASTGRC
jgi:predicted amidophosphoribosyltransferase